jgi:hypothetical protein
MKVAAGVVLIGLVAVAASSAARSASPQSLYRDLLTKPYTGLPSGYYSAKVGADSLNEKDKRHHAVGAVLVNIDSGDAAVDYVIYPGASDVAARWREPPTKPEGVVQFQVMGTVPGYGRTRSRWINATVEGSNAFGKKVRNGLTVMYVQQRNVIVIAATVSTDNDTSGDVPATIKLMKSGIAHLDRVAGWSRPTGKGVGTTRPASPVTPRDARASPYVGGNRSPRLPAGTRGVLSVVAQGPYHQEQSVPVVVRNNTSRTAIRVSVSGTASFPSGRLLATGKDQGLNPNLVKPGEIAFGYVYFNGVRLPSNTRFRFKVTSTPPDQVQFENRRDLVVAESHRVQERVLGTLRNGYGVRVTGPIQASVACFSSAGRLLYTANDFTDQDNVAARGTLPFQVDTAPAYGSSGLSCPVYLVAASGYTP